MWRRVKLTLSMILGRYFDFQTWMRQTKLGGWVLRIMVTLVGVLVLIAGVIMLIGPGQGILAIIAGFAILATEYSWADNVVKKLRHRFELTKTKLQRIDYDLRRRRALLSVVFALIAIVYLWLFLHQFGWPGWFENFWDWLRHYVAFLPRLPQIGETA